MNAVMRQCLQQITLGDPRVHKNMTVFALFHASESSIRLRSLDEALESGIIEVTELGSEGSVPELKVVNKSDNLVLLLDGEELQGAKQNRILNSTILLAGKTEANIPVSCTERGRWRYASKLFSSSGYMMSQKLRTGKARSVALSLSLLGKHKSDQSKVWASIDKQAVYARVRSSTSAMSDVHDSLQGRLKPFQDACPYLPSQKGLLVAIDGQVVGFDLLTSDSAYKQYHSKLLRSYAIDALLSRTKAESTMPLEKAVAFIQQCSLCKEEEHASVGLGTDYRYTGPILTGFALVHDDEVVHAAFLRQTEDILDEKKSPDREHVQPDDVDREE